MPADRATLSPALDPALLRRQDAAEFTRLVNQTQRIVLGLGQSLGLRDADLDDAAAETYLAVYRALPGFQERSQITTWVYAIAARTLRRWRTRARRATMNALPDAPPIDSQMATPAEDAEANETHARVWAAVAGLEPRSAMAVELFYRRGMDVESIASVLDCPAGTVKTLLFRAREVLRVRLKEEVSHV